MPRTREELINNIMDEAYTMRNYPEAQRADHTIRELLDKAFLDDQVFIETWKKFFREDE